jgi:hypothetical protein
MSMAVASSAESAAAKTAVADAAIVRPSSVRSRPAIRAAVAGSDKAHRYRTDGGSAHQRQYDAPRTFHGTPVIFNAECSIETRAFASRKPKRIVSRDRAARSFVGCRPPPGPGPIHAGLSPTYHLEIVEAQDDAPALDLEQDFMIDYNVTLLSAASHTDGK